MKQLYFLSILILLTFFAKAGQIVTATQNNGYWSNGSTWNTNHVPTSGDSVVIPSNLTVILNGDESINNVGINISGTLKFMGNGTSLALNKNSLIYVGPTGLIDGTSAGNQKITIGGYTVFTGTDITGVKVVDATTGFVFTPVSSGSALPVKFIGFNVARKSNDVLIQWSTAQEINANVYELERSYDGSNWNTIAYVTAVGNSNATNNYTFTDKNNTAAATYYRVKEVDLSGSYAYTSVKSIKTQTVTTASVNITAAQSNTVLQFPAQVKGNVVVSVVSLNGQVLSKQVLSNPVGQVALNNNSLKGHYIIAVSNGQDLNVAKQILL